MRLDRHHLVRMVLCIGIGAIAFSAMAKESSVPESTFRKYFWGARQAYEERDFKKAARLLQVYREMGSPSDKMLKQAGCDPKWEVAVFSSALKDARACISHRSKSISWADAEHAKLAILLALRAGDAASLENYIDCAPTDLVMQSTTCGARLYHKPAEMERLVVVLKKNPDILKWLNWRHFPVLASDPQRISWGLYSYSDLWKPCGMQGAPIITLREDPSGQVRIAGFAASCLGEP